MSDFTVVKLLDAVTITGQSGYSGYSGFSGYSGYSGDGTSGYSGYSGYSGSPGGGDHSLLSNLDYDNSGHTEFQKVLTYEAAYKAFLVPY